MPNKQKLLKTLSQNAEMVERKYDNLNLHVEGRRTALSSIKTVPDSDEEDHCGLSIEQILALKEQFDAADTDGGGSLDLNEFMDAFDTVVQSTGKKFEDVQIERLFMQIDANSDGGIDWSEFSDYMLMESEANQTEIAEKVASFYLPDKSGTNSELEWHGSPVTCIAMESQSGVYITTAKDLTIKLWGYSMSLMKTINCQDWVFAMCVLPGLAKLVTASADRRIRLYDTHTWDKFREILLPNPAICLCSWKHGDDEMLAYGDDKGRVTVVNVSKGFVNADLVDSEENRLATWARSSTKCVHTGWIHEIKMVEDLGGLMSCGSDSTIVIFEYPMKDNPHRKHWIAPKRIMKSSRGHTKGVKCIEWVRSQKVIVSGGLERVIVIWNPYTGNPIGQLVGHQFGIEKIFYNAQFDQIISLSADHVVKVWDLVHSDCIQTICSIEVHTKPTTMIYDVLRNKLITTNRKPFLWRINPRILLPTSETTHRSDIVAVLLNRIHGQLVTVAEDTETCVWRVSNGKKIFSYFDTQRDEDSPLSCAAFDEAGRRLITGDHQGKVRVWNFNNGGCLKILRKPEDQNRRREVTAVTCYILQDKKFIAASGWDRRVTVWLDSFDAPVEPFLQIDGHETDILSMGFTFPKNLITCALDGSIHVFDIESGAKKIAMHYSRAQDTPIDVKPKLKAYMTALDTSVRASRSQREASLSAVPEFSRTECIEKICVLNAKNKSLVGVSTDGRICFWEGTYFRLVLMIHGRHQQSFGLVDVQTDKTNTYLVTADQGGFVKTWNISEFDSGKANEQQIKPLCFWQAHEFEIASVDIVPFPKKADRPVDLGRHGRSFDFIVVTASSDRRVRAWSSDARLIGQFGQGGEWALDNSSTWESKISKNILGLETDSVAKLEIPETDEEAGRQQSDVLKLLDEKLLGMKPAPVSLMTIPMKEVGDISRKFKKKDYSVDPLTGERIYKASEKKAVVPDEKPRAMSPYLRSFLKKIDPDNVV